MFILLYGPDAYRRREKREEVVAQFLSKHTSAGLGRFDLESDADAFVGFLRNQSMFAPVRLAVVTNLFSDDSKSLIELVSSFMSEPSTTILVSESGKPPKPWAFLLKSKSVLAQTFEELKGPAWLAFLRAEARRRGLVLASPAEKLVAQVYQGDSWRLVTELDRLALLGRKDIALADLGELSLEVAPDFWTMVNGFRSSRLGERLATLEQAFGRNEPAAKLFHILAYQNKARLPLFAAYDLAVKTGKLEYEEALLDSIL